MTTSQGPRRVLRTKPWLVAVIVLANLLFLAGAILSYSEAGWTRDFAIFAVLVVVGISGIAQLAVTSITLEGDSLETNELFVQHRYLASEIRSVKWEGGSGVSLELVQGGWAKLPEMGYNSQSLTNTLRAWLKRCQGGEE